jgi:hypothetical protein
MSEDTAKKSEGELILRIVCCSVFTRLWWVKSHMVSAFAQAMADKCSFGLKRFLAQEAF